jgi:hypothetical protein
MDWQEIGVYLITSLAVGYTLYHIIIAFRQKNYSPGCAHCNGSCQVRPAKNKMLRAQK